MTSAHLYMSKRYARTKPSEYFRSNVEGAPFSIGQSIIVCGVADWAADRSFLFRRGIIAYFNYDCGCGQTYPQDPMIGVLFPSGHVEEFWREELSCLSNRTATGRL